MRDSKWNIEIIQSASDDYNAVRKRWVEQSKTLEEAKANAACACEECGTSLAGADVFQSPYDWLCEACAEDQGYLDPEDRYEPGDDYDLIDGVGFADPYGHSALRAETSSNPRDQSCPSCGTANVLTRIDRQRGYQCDSCADRAEMGGW